MADAISDSSTLIHLAKIGRLHLLREFHKKILIAPAVWREVVGEGRNWPGSSEVEQGKQAGWIEVVEPTNRTLIHLVRKCFYSKQKPCPQCTPISPIIVLRIAVLPLNSAGKPPQLPDQRKVHQS
jgi:hypothetical protein